MYVVEFQKRGLPHAHILIIFADYNKMRGPHDYDGLVCAEIPDAEKEPALFKAVKQFNIHGPCGDRHPSSFLFDVFSTVTQSWLCCVVFSI
jgi:hypothetical protein